MEEIQTEIQDSTDASPEHKVGTVGTSAVTIQRTDGKDCVAVHVNNPVLGTRANDFDDVLYITTDGQAPATYGQTIHIGEGITIRGKITHGNIKIASNNANTNYEIVLEG